MRAATLVLPLGLGLLLYSGCGRTYPTAPVHGRVTHKGQALLRGRVIFHHHSGRYGFGDIGPEGRYTLQAPLGPCRVAITSRKEPPTHPPPGMLILDSYIPERYEDHMQSGLTFDVQPMANTADWHLK